MKAVAQTLYREPVVFLGAIQGGAHGSRSSSGHHRLDTARLPGDHHPDPALLREAEEEAMSAVTVLIIVVLVLLAIYLIRRI